MKKSLALKSIMIHTMMRSITLSPVSYTHLFWYYNNGRKEEWVMKILLKVFFVGFLIFMGMQLYSCASRRAYERELIKQGNVAYQEGDFSLFKEIFEYYKDCLLYTSRCV